MMNPDMMRAAAEMMKNMKKEDLEAMTRQMQNMPSMPGMGAPGMPSPAAAAEMMKGMRPEDLQFMARQMQSLPPEQLQRMAAQMGGAGGAGGQGMPTFDPSSVSGAARVLQQRQRYELDAAIRLKEEGNKLHGAGKYAEASEKYSRARNNLSSHASSEAASVRKACTLNLMSCNLKVGKESDAVSLGDEILAQDPKNLKALYRRGQAHLKLGHLQSAVADLTEAAKITPDDDTLAGVLREAREGLAQKQALGLSGDGEGGSKDEEEKEVENKNGVTIEDVTEQEEEVPTSTRAAEPAVGAQGGSPPTTGSGAPALGPEAIRNLQAMSSMPPEQVAALSGGRITPEMARMASSMVSQMGPGELQRMMDMAARFGGGMPPPPGAASGFPFPSSSPIPPQEIAGGSGGLGSGASGAAPNVSWSSSSGSGSGGAGSVGASASARAGGAAGGVGAPGAGLGNPLAGLGGAGGNPMEDPQMMKMMSDMMQSMAPEDLAAMSAQMGRPMTVEQARQTKELMSKVGPQHLATMMKWSNKAQGAMHQGRQALNWLLRRPALLIAILVVIIAVLGRWLGYF